MMKLDSNNWRGLKSAAKDNTADKLETSRLETEVQILVVPPLLTNLLGLSSCLSIPPTIFKADRQRLINNSGYFAKMLSNCDSNPIFCNGMGSNTVIAPLTVSPLSFSIILESMEKGTPLPLTLSNWQTLYQAAEVLEMPKAISACKAFWTQHAVNLLTSTVGAGLFGTTSAFANGNGAQTLLNLFGQSANHSHQQADKILDDGSHHSSLNENKMISERMIEEQYQNFGSKSSIVCPKPPRDQTVTAEKNHETTFESRLSVGFNPATTGGSQIQRPAEQVQQRQQEKEEQQKQQRQHQQQKRITISEQQHLQPRPSASADNRLDKFDAEMRKYQAEWIDIENTRYENRQHHLQQQLKAQRLQLANTQQQQQQNLRYDEPEQQQQQLQQHQVKEQDQRQHGALGDMLLCGMGSQETVTKESVAGIECEQDNSIDERSFSGSQACIRRPKNGSEYSRVSNKSSDESVTVNIESSDGEELCESMKARKRKALQRSMFGVSGRRKPATTADAEVLLTTCDGPIKFQRVPNPYSGAMGAQKAGRRAHKRKSYESKPATKASTDSKRSISIEAFAGNSRDRERRAKQLKLQNLNIDTASGVMSSEEGCPGLNSDVSGDSVFLPSKNRGNGLSTAIDGNEKRFVYFPCKRCGKKFPSYYFVHKHRRFCEVAEGSE